MTSPPLPHLPSGPLAPPCAQCTALCCRYYALEIDAPEDRDDFDKMRWWLLHGKSWIWVQDGEWHLQVDEPCRFLGPDHECLIYNRRPQVCRDYGLPEADAHPEEPLCDYFTQEASHDLEFREPEELDAYAERFLARRAARRASRRKP